MRTGGPEGAPRADFALRFVFPELRAPLAPAAGESVLVGREVGGPGQLPGGAISRRHAELRRHGRELLIEDLGSRNGVFVNARRVEQGRLRLHDVVRIGDWVAVVVADGEASIDEGAGDPRLHLGPTASRLAAPARRLAPTGIALVLEGETGTGKERFACAIHGWSGRKGPLIAINCAALPEALAEAELFGHREGAFTSAIRASQGHFRAAQGGTLFLDEVTDMPPAVQAKVLRALEQKEVLPLGESRPVPVDVRILCATQVPLAQAVADKRLRADLHARLQGFTLRLPPLRERRADIPSLFVHLLGRHGSPRRCCRRGWWRRCAPMPGRSTRASSTFWPRNWSRFFRTHRCCAGRICPRQSGATRRRRSWWRQRSRRQPNPTRRRRCLSASSSCGWPSRARAGTWRGRPAPWASRATASTGSWATRRPAVQEPAAAAELTGLFRGGFDNPPAAD